MDDNEGEPLAEYHWFFETPFSGDETAFFYNTNMPTSKQLELWSKSLRRESKPSGHSPTTEGNACDSPCFLRKNSRSPFRRVSPVEVTCYACNRPSRKDADTPEYWQRVRSLSRENRMRLDSREMLRRWRELEKYQKIKEILTKRKREKMDLASRYLRIPLKKDRRRCVGHASTSEPDLKESQTSINSSYGHYNRSPLLNEHSNRSVSACAIPHRKCSNRKVTRDNQKAYPTRSIDELRILHSSFRGYGEIPFTGAKQIHNPVEMDSFSMRDKGIRQLPHFGRRRSMPDMENLKSGEHEVIFESNLSLPYSENLSKLILKQQSSLKTMSNIEGKLSSNFVNNVMKDYNFNIPMPNYKILKERDGIANSYFQTLNKREKISNMLPMKDINYEDNLNDSKLKALNLPASKPNDPFTIRQRTLSHCSEENESNESYYYDSLEEDTKSQGFYITTDGGILDLAAGNIVLPLKIENRLKLRNKERKDTERYANPIVNDHYQGMGLSAYQHKYYTKRGKTNEHSTRLANQSFDKLDEKVLNNQRQTNEKYNFKKQIIRSGLLKNVEVECDFYICNPLKLVTGSNANKTFPPFGNTTVSHLETTVPWADLRYKCLDNLVKPNCNLDEFPGCCNIHGTNFSGHDYSPPLGETQFEKSKQKVYISHSASNNNAFAEADIILGQSKNLANRSFSLASLHKNKHETYCAFHTCNKIVANNLNQHAECNNVEVSVEETSPVSNECMKTLQFNIGNNEGNLAFLNERDEADAFFTSRSCITDGIMLKQQLKPGYFNFKNEDEGKTAESDSAEKVTIISFEHANDSHKFEFENLESNSVESNASSSYKLCYDESDSTSSSDQITIISNPDHDNQKSGNSLVVSDFEFDSSISNWEITSSKGLSQTEVTDTQYVETKDFVETKLLNVIDTTDSLNTGENYNQLHDEEAGSCSHDITLSKSTILRKNTYNPKDKEEYTANNNGDFTYEAHTSTMTFQEFENSLGEVNEIAILDLLQRNICTIVSDTGEEHRTELVNHMCSDENILKFQEADPLGAELSGRNSYCEINEDSSKEENFCKDQQSVENCQKIVSGSVSHRKMQELSDNSSNSYCSTVNFTRCKDYEKEKFTENFFFNYDRNAHEKVINNKGKDQWQASNRLRPKLKHSISFDNINNKGKDQWQENNRLKPKLKHSISFDNINKYLTWPNYEKCRLLRYDTKLGANSKRGTAILQFGEQTLLDEGDHYKGLSEKYALESNSQDIRNSGKGKINPLDNGNFSEAIVLNPGYRLSLKRNKETDTSVNRNEKEKNVNLRNKTNSNRKSKVHLLDAIMVKSQPSEGPRAKLTAEKLVGAGITKTQIITENRNSAACNTKPRRKKLSNSCDSNCMMSEGINELKLEESLPSETAIMGNRQYEVNIGDAMSRYNKDSTLDREKIITFKANGMENKLQGREKQTSTLCEGISPERDIHIGGNSPCDVTALHSDSNSRKTHDDNLCNQSMDGSSDRCFTFSGIEKNNLDNYEMGHLPNTPILSENESTSAHTSSLVDGYLDSLERIKLNDNQRRTKIFKKIVNPSSFTSRDEDDVNYPTRIPNSKEVRRQQRNWFHLQNLDNEEIRKQTFRPPFMASNRHWTSDICRKANRSSNEKINDIIVEIFSSQNTRNIILQAKDGVKVVIETSSLSNPLSHPTKSKQKLHTTQEQSNLTLSNKRNGKIIESLGNRQPKYEYMNKRSPEIIRNDEWIQNVSDVKVEGNNITKCFFPNPQHASRPLLNTGLSEKCLIYSLQRELSYWIQYTL